VIVTVLVYLPWLAVDVLMETLVAAGLAPEGESRRCARFAAAAALATHGLATTLRCLWPHDPMTVELAWAAVDYALWRALAGVPAGLALRLTIGTNFAAAAAATVLWFTLAF